MTEQSTDIVLAMPADKALPALFATEGGFDPLLSRIEEEARSFVPDLTTVKGRKAIASLAYKIAQSKTALDGAGKKLNEEARAHIAVVDASRRAIRDRLDALKDEVRKPLDDWEAAEEKRVAALKLRLDTLDRAADVDPEMSSSDLRHCIEAVEAIAIDDSWAEYLPLAAKAKDTALAALRRALPIAEKREADAAELERLRAEQAKRDAEAQAKREAEEAEARNKALIEKSQARAREMAKLGRAAFKTFWNSEADAEVRAAIEPIMDELRKLADDADARLAQEAEKRAAKAAADAKAQAEKEAAELAEIERREAANREARIKEEAEQAAQRERDRIAAEKKAEDDARAEREADKAHRARVLKDIAEALAPVPREQIAAALMDGRIPHVKVNL